MTALSSAAIIKRGTPQKGQWFEDLASNKLLTPSGRPPEALGAVGIDHHVLGNY